VIHTVGPVYAAQDPGRAALLASCYRESLRVADELGARTVAMPAVSTGVYGWPADDAARIALRTVREVALETGIRVVEVRFVLFGTEAFGVFESVRRELGL
jgi:O-acetyl-ADP-ribose deacetylase (regulator of RNase III)